MPQVSVLLLTYNSDPTALRRALTAIAQQKEVDLEVIISDDGSVKKDFSFLPDFMAEAGISQWKLLENPENRGTVFNCLAAAEAATGTYTFTTSPGDFLFDQFVLRDFYRFAQKHDCALCFGNAVYYSCTDSKPEHSRLFGQPLRPQHYAVGAPRWKSKTAFFSGDWVVGACYFYKLPCLLESLKAIAGKIIYTEDTPTTMLFMAQGYPLCYYDRNMVWYEHGTGISTSGSSKWDRLVLEDLHAGYRLLKERFPKDPYIDYAHRHALQAPGWRRSVGNFLRHPLIMLRLRLLQKAPKKEAVCTAADWKRLETLLEIQ